MEVRLLLALKPTLTSFSMIAPLTLFLPRATSGPFSHPCPAHPSRFDYTAPLSDTFYQPKVYSAESLIQMLRRITGLRLSCAREKSLSPLLKRSQKLLFVLLLSL
jgi:hypothetical protein